MPSLPLADDIEMVGSSVELRRPDGTTTRAEIEIVTQHTQVRRLSDRSLPLVWSRACVVRGASAADVPAGTEVWCRDD